MSKLFSPIKIGNITVKNRIEVAPAAPFLAGADSTVTPELFAYTSNLARSGAGIVMLGVSGVDPSDGFGEHMLSVTRPYLQDLNDIAEGIQSGGAKAGIELVTSRFMLAPPEFVVNELTTADIEGVIRAFADAAVICRRAGFDLIMIHGGHGNVPAMFFNKKFNHRKDRFGERERFGIELLSAIRDATDGELAVEYRISAEEMLPDMTTLEETLEYAKTIEPYIDLLHVSRGLLDRDELLPYINAPTYFPRGMNLPYAKKFKEILNIPVSVVGSFDLELAEKAVEDGDVDMVAMIRTVLADTECVDKYRRGKSRDIRPCIRCNYCISRTHSQMLQVRCSVNPLIGRETRFPGGEADRTRRVVVVGGGPAGLEASRTAAARGHAVTLVEREYELGGIFRLASHSELKAELKKYLDWSIRSVMSHPMIDVQLGLEAEPGLIAALNPEVVIIAAGAEPILPKFSASGTRKIVWAGDVERDASLAGDDVVIAGAGVTGLELALTLTNLGKRVRVIDMLPREKIGQGGTAINMIALNQLLERNNVEIIPSVRLSDVTEDGAIIARGDDTETLTCDTVILSFGFRPNSAKLREFESVAETVLYIGDCAATTGGTLRNAVRQGFDAAMMIK